MPMESENLESFGLKADFRESLKPSRVRNMGRMFVRSSLDFRKLFELSDTIRSPLLFHSIRIITFMLVEVDQTTSTSR